MGSQMGGKGDWQKLNVTKLLCMRRHPCMPDPVGTAYVAI